MMVNRKLFKSVNNYAVYYGHGREDELSKFDMVIVEPKGHKGDAVKKLSHSGTMVIAYVSVMEIAEHDLFFKLLKEEDFLKYHGKTMMNYDFNTYMLDMGSKNWSSLLIHHIGNLIYNGGYHGIFLDTIGDIERIDLSQSKIDYLLTSAINLVSNIRKNFQDIVIIQNNGLDIIYQYTAHIIDGICWENPPVLKIESHSWVRETEKLLHNLQIKQSLKVMVVAEHKKNESNSDYIKDVKKLADRNSFLFYSSLRNYIEITA